MTPRPPGFPAPGHDHAGCVARALHEARARCRREGLRLTPQRQKVLEIVWSSHVPIGAYDILAQITAGGRHGAPMTVYRALDFLQAHGFVHRLASLNAFIGCADPEHGRDSQFFVCRGCGSVAEILDRQLGAALRACAGRSRFDIEHTLLELQGLCAYCAECGGDER